MAYALHLPRCQVTLIGGHCHLLSIANLFFFLIFFACRQSMPVRGGVAKDVYGMGSLHYHAFAYGPGYSQSASA